ncbi:MAG: anti-sigma factor [Acidobacteria bacterium]|nr:anti-sigma factor [Acidobacteriota bacterium]MBI3658070.1 anti-sigma factor [Acidobacteriota bacterium]
MTNQACEAFEEIGALVAVGAADSQDQKALEVHLDGCTTCRSVLCAWQETASHLAQTIRAVQPPSAVRARILEAIKWQELVAPRRARAPFTTIRFAVRRFDWLSPLAWALAGVFGGLFVWNMQVHTRVTQRHEAELATIRRALSEKQNALQLMAARQTHTIRLKGLSVAPDTAGKVFWNPEINSGILVVFNLPALPPENVYQLWAIPQGSSPVANGTFIPDSGGAATLKLNSLPHTTQLVNVFAVTAEPSGGSSQPTGAMYLSGTAAAF